jgi:ABC-type branched-subunit amino acid transport system ATPase component/MFS family permease
MTATDTTTGAAPDGPSITWADFRESVRGVISPRRWAAGLRHPGTGLREIAGNGPVFALLILFGLNCVDELDRTGFGILLPNVRDAFGMTNTGILTLVGLTALGALLLQLPIAVWADRGNRVFITLLGAAMWAVFSIFTGAATAIWMLVIARAGSGIGRAVVDPTHASLLSDYYPVDRRPAVFSFHRAANVLGQFLGPLLAGMLAYAFSWRMPFYVFAVPTIILVILGTRMKEPVRGAQERRASGASEDVIATEEPTASFSESWRLLWKIDVLRRIWYAVPFLAVSLIGFVSLASLLYSDVYHLDELQRGYLAAVVEPFQLLGLAVGARLGTRLFLKDPALIFRFLRWVAFTASLLAACFALAPSLWLAVIFNVALTTDLAILLPGILATLSLAIPARARAVGFSVASWWAIPGLALLPLIGWIGDNWGTRLGMLVMTPILLIGGLMISSGGSVIKRDIDDVWKSSTARSQALVDRRQGRSKLLVVHDLNVGYNGLQVLFDVNMEVAEGEIVALLGTNGAGKSTLLRAVSGITEADFGAVIFDGRDITHAPPNEIAALGVAQVPGGAGVFPSLTVRENLRSAGWLLRRDRAGLHARIEETLDVFPVLRERLDEPAANLSGGQQQMLALGMALLSRPRLLIIDELSLGLAPVIVSKLAELVRGVAAEGTTVLLVEQSVNVALTMATTAYFMERGRVQFSGPAPELLERPDLLRAVFLADGSVPDTVAPPTGGAAAPATGGAAAPAAGGAAAPAAGEAPVDGAVTNGAAPADGAVPTHGGAVGSGPPAPVTAALELRDVTRRFGGINAVDSVTITVAPGEIVGLIGQNGAGKTTIFDLVCGYQPLDGGRILLGGRDVSKLSPGHRARLGLGRTFQGGRLFPGLTVAETVAVSLDRSTSVKDPFNAALRLPPHFDSEQQVATRVHQLLELFGLAAYRDSFTAELSTGTRRIVELACSVGHQPTVLLLDEPAGGVAQREVEQLGLLLRRIRDELGCSMVVIEHDMPMIAGLSDRLVALETGVVIAEGAPSAVLTDPRVIASYLGDDHAAVARSGTAPPTGT